MTASLQHSGGISPICMPADFARAGRGALAVSFHGKNTRLKASAPAIVVASSQADNLGGHWTARLQAGIGECSQLLRSFIKQPEQPASCLTQRFKALSFTAVSHEEQGSERNTSWVASFMSRVTRCLS